MIVQFLKGGASGEIPLLESLGAKVLRGKAGSRFSFFFAQKTKHSRSKPPPPWCSSRGEQGRAANKNPALGQPSPRRILMLSRSKLHTLPGGDAPVRQALELDGDLLVLDEACAAWETDLVDRELDDPPPPPRRQPPQGQPHGRGGLALALPPVEVDQPKAGISKAALSKLGGEAVCFMADPETVRQARERGVTRAAVCMERGPPPPPPPRRP